MTARDRIRAINEGRTPGPCTHGEVETNVSRGRLTCRKCRLSVSLSDAHAIVAWERLSGPLLDLWAALERGHRVNAPSHAPDFGHGHPGDYSLVCGICRTRAECPTCTALAAIEAAAKEVRALLEQESYNSRSFALITPEAITAIEREARAATIAAIRARVDKFADDGDIGGYESGWHDCRAVVLALLDEEASR